MSNESEVVDLFARLVVIPVRWLYAGLYRVGILEVSGIRITSLDMDEVLANSYNDTDARLVAGRVRAYVSDIEAAWKVHQ